TLFDANFKLSNVQSLKQTLLKTNINDKVIIAYSGHGLLSKQYDYYLSSYTVNFKNPEENGIAYEEIENLLDNIPARKKLLLLDACHSGEVDKDEMLAIQQAKSKQGSKGLIMNRGSEDEIIETKTVGLQNSFELMQSLFVNVGKGTGSTIISAAGGVQFAQERDDLENGVFTFSLLEALSQNPTIKVSELKQYVGWRVEELTKGLQKPTTRNELKDFDWTVW
ncbi:MAG: caspase family protein, partial [Lacibacter sp.]|nr:caspase family protein [Lacibacter sp.]